MKPLNADTQGCDPISSNCVIWQGPDIPCIDLCKGDTVSTVVAKLGEELCQILVTLNIETYDLTCFNLTDCAPKDFVALIQLLIDRICALEGISSTTLGGSVDSSVANANNPINTRILSGDNIPDAVIDVPEAYWYTNPEGDTVKTMQLIDYVVAVGNRVATIINQVNTINLALANHEGRLVALETVPAPTSYLPNIAPICVLPASPLVPLDTLVIALEQEFCDLKSATGTPLEIYKALVKQCVGLGSSPQLQNGGVNMDAIPDWVSSVTTLADGFTNMWLTICDLRDAVKSIQESCCTTTSCDDLVITVTGTLTTPNTLKLYFAGTFPTGFTESSTSGSLVTIVDADGNSMTIAIPIIANLNVAAGYTIDLTTTPINGSSNLTVTVPLSFTDGSSTCEKVVTEVVIATGNCPIVSLVPTTNTIAYSYTYMSGAASLSIKLYAEDGVTLLQTDVSVVTGPSTETGTFTGLVPGLQYKVRLEITPSGAPEATLCPFSGVITLSNACIPPNNLNGTINIT